MQGLNHNSESMELIALMVADQVFCIDIGAVREIRGWTAATPVPQTPDYVLGVINLRGAVMPVIDLRARLGLGAAALSGRHVTVVVQEGEALVGLVVDGVQETIIVKTADLQPPPAYASPDTVFVDAMIPRGRDILSRLSLAALLPPEVRAGGELQAA